MHNCAVSRIPAVVKGDAALYHGQLAGMALTIQIEPSATGWKLGEVEAFGTRPPSPQARRVLNQWLGHLENTHGCKCADA